MVAKIIGKLSERPIIEVEINKKKGNMLIDTGASVSLIGDDIMHKYGFSKSKRFPMKFIGFGGQESVAYHPDNLNVNIMGVMLNQFVISDITAIRNNILDKVGIEIDGIIGVPAIHQSEMVINIFDNEIKIGK